MAVNLSPVWGAGAQLFDNSGNVLSGGKIYTYAAGTTTPEPTYTSGSGATAHSNPIVLNSAGRVPYEIWLTDGILYKIVLKDSNDALIGTWDNIEGVNSNFVAYTGQNEIQVATAGQTVFTLTTMEYNPGVDNLVVFVDGVNQYGPDAQYAFVETDSTTVTFSDGLHVGAVVRFSTATMTSVFNYSVLSGTTNPTSGDGVNGDFYINTTSWEIFGPKAAGAWGAGTSLIGPTGATGTAATIAVGTTTTGAAGSSASVTNSGTSSAAVFDFTIPRGDTGATGPTGPTGPTGATGNGIVSVTLTSGTHAPGTLDTYTILFTDTSTTTFQVYNGANGTGTGTVTSVSGTSPISVATGTTTPIISLDSGYGDTQNPYASKTANYFLAAPNGSAGAPTFRAMIAADVPTLNQNTTGSAGSVANALTAGTGISFSSGTTYNGSAAITINNSGLTTYPGAGLAVSTGSAWGTSKTSPTGDVVGTTDTQTLSGKTITGTKETVYTITDGAAFEIDPANGGIQTITLGASRTPAATNFTAGQSVTLMINDGSAYTITWTTVNPTWVGGSAPTLATSGYTVIELWKVGSTIYGAYVGAVA